MIEASPLLQPRRPLMRVRIAPADGRVYIERAEEGLRRLGTILTRMSEATRLEQGLASVEREPFDLAAVVAGCVEELPARVPGPAPSSSRLPLEHRGRERLTRPRGAASLTSSWPTRWISRARGEPVRVSLVGRRRDRASWSVANQGAPLPDAMRGKLFESMWSRARRAGHGRKVERAAPRPGAVRGAAHRRIPRRRDPGAENLASGGGVAVTATFRLA